jgi:two-component system, response regulator PdtaR
VIPPTKPKRSVSSTLQPIRTSPSPLFRPRLVFARDSSLGSDKSGAASPRILVVEDDFLVADQMESVLENAGFIVAGVVTSAEEAIKAAGDQKIDLAIMDIRLSGKRDGIDAALELYRTLQVRCLFATAHSDPAIQKRAEAARPLGWLQKPYSMASLLQSVRNAIDALDRI